MNIANDLDIDYNAPTYFMHSPLFQVFPSSKQSKDYLFDSARSKGYTKRDPSAVEMDYLFQVSCAQKS